jgi:mRNA-degrading endonuclease RelE of RelBE toxin-antitoxin system
VIGPPAAPRRIGRQETPQPVPFLIRQIVAIQSLKHHTDLHQPGIKIHGTRPSPHRVGKPLKLGLEGLHSARRGDYRVIYRIDDERRLVTVMAIEYRSDIYRPRRL